MTPEQLSLEFFHRAPEDAVVDAFRRVHRSMRPRTRLPAIHAQFVASVGANHSATLEDDRLEVRVSDLFHDAPDEILDSLAAILLSKLYKKKVDPSLQRIYRSYTLTDSMIERMHSTRARRGRRRRTTGPVGRVYDLAILFEELNTRYFDGTLRRPELSWTRRRTRNVMGRYDFDQDVIFVSRTLDSEDVPRHVVSYILYHEMLHVMHGTEVRNSTERVHTPAFRRDERRYALYREATQWLASN